MADNKVFVKENCDNELMVIKIYLYYIVEEF